MLEPRKLIRQAVVHRAEGAGTFVNGGTDPSGVVFPIGTSFFGPGFGLEPSGGRGDEGTKKRETDLLGVASRLRSEEVRSSGPRRARSLVWQTNRLHGVLGT